MCIYIFNFHIKHFICLLLLIISSINLFAQEELEEKGKNWFSKKNYVAALPIYKKLFEQEPDNIDYNYCLAVCYLNTFSNRENAISHLEYISQKKNDLIENARKLLSGDMNFFRKAKKQSQQADPAHGPGHRHLNLKGVEQTTPKPKHQLQNAAALNRMSRDQVNRKRRISAQP